MKIKTAYTLIFAVILYSCNVGFSQNDKAINIFETNLEVLERYFNEETIEGGQLDKSIIFFEDLTGIKSDIGDGYDDIRTPTIENLNQWKDWFKRNKDKLYWNQQEQKIKINK